MIILSLVNTRGSENSHQIKMCCNIRTFNSIYTTLRDGGNLGVAGHSDTYTCIGSSLIRNKRVPRGAETLYTEDRGMNALRCLKEI